MPAYDLFHNAAKHAIEKDGWTVTHDPLTLPFGGVDLYIDLGAEKLLAAERGNKKIAIEVKNFISASLVSEFHTALGQFLNYRLALAESEPDRELYLAIPEDAYKTFFQLPFTQKAIAQHQLKLLVFKPEQEEVSAWKN